MKMLSMLVLACGLVTAGCRDRASTTQTATVAWRKVGSWSGRGSTQTEPFISDTGSLRLQWETRNERAPGRGFFRVIVHSDVSGRPLLVAVDSKGVGHNVAYVSEDPRSFFLAVESSDLDWTLAADEAVPATVVPKTNR